MGSFSISHLIFIGIPGLIIILVIRALWSYISRNNAQARSEHSNTALMQSLLTGQAQAAAKLAALETSLKESHDRLEKIEKVLATVE